MLFIRNCPVLVLLRSWSVLDYVGFSHLARRNLAGMAALFATFFSCLVYADIQVTGDVGTPNVDSFLEVGSNGIGALTVSAGSVLIAADGMGIGSDFDPDPGGGGTVTITDVSSQLNVGGGPDDNTHNVHVGNGGTGTLVVTNSASAVINANGQEEAAIFVGRNAGSGIMNISNQAQITVTGGMLNTLYLGRTGTGEANVTGGGTLTIEDDTANRSFDSGILIGGTGSDPGGTGTLNIDGTNSSVLIRDDSGVFVNIGRNGVTGTGTVNVTNGGVLDIESDTEFSTINIGRSGARGELNVSGGTVRIGISPAGGALEAFLAVGRTAASGNALTIDNGGLLEIEDPDNEGGAFIATVPGGSGDIRVDGTGSVLDANALLGVGVDFNLSDGGDATLTVIDGGMAKADSVVIGTPGEINGNSTVMGAILNNGGDVRPGPDTDTLTVVGDYVQDAGLLEIEIGGTGPDQLDVVEVSNDVVLNNGLIRFLFVDGFEPITDDTFTFLISGGTIVLDKSNVSYEFLGAANSFQFDVSVVDNNQLVLTVGELVDAPIGIPTLNQLSLALLAVLLAVLGYHGQRRMG